MTRPPMNGVDEIDYIQYKNEDDQWAYYVPVKGTETSHYIDVLQIRCEWEYEIFLYDQVEKFGREYE